MILLHLKMMINNNIFVKYHLGKNHLELSKTMIKIFYQIFLCNKMSILIDLIFLINVIIKGVHFFKWN